MQFQSSNRRVSISTVSPSDSGTNWDGTTGINAEEFQWELNSRNKRYDRNVATKRSSEGIENWVQEQVGILKPQLDRMFAWTWTNTKRLWRNDNQQPAVQPRRGKFRATDFDITGLGKGGLSPWAPQPQQRPRTPVGQSGKLTILTLQETTSDQVWYRPQTGPPLTLLPSPCAPQPQPLARTLVGQAGTLQETDSGGVWYKPQAGPPLTLLPEFLWTI